jgi:hypothetical protein
MSKIEELTRRLRMDTNNLALAEEYYTLIGEKNGKGIEKYLHPSVELYSPLATVKGKEAVFKSASHFIDVIKSLTIRAKFGAGEQAMLVLDSEIPGVTGNFPTASLLSFCDGLIVKIELFYDGGRLVPKKEEIFS